MFYQHAWIQRGCRILKNHLQSAAQPEPFYAGLFFAGKICRHFRIINMPAGRLEQADDCLSGSGLAAARFSDHPETFPAIDIQVDAVQGLDGADFAAQHPP
jgi:hypothetical protein